MATSKGTEPMLQRINLQVLNNPGHVFYCSPPTAKLLWKWLWGSLYARKILPYPSGTFCDSPLDIDDSAINTKVAYHYQSCIAICVGWHCQELCQKSHRVSATGICTCGTCFPCLLITARSMMLPAALGDLTSSNSCCLLSS